MATMLRAADLMRLLEEEVFDIHRAAEYLGLQPNSIEVAAIRQRIPYVHLHRMKLFTKADLDEYKRLSRPGRSSRLTRHQAFQIQR